MFPHGLHLLGVVVHVALQPDALWGALQHQLGGRRACKHATGAQSHNGRRPGWRVAQPLQLTSDLGDGVDDVVKHCGQDTERLLLAGKRTRVRRGGTLAGDVERGGVFAPVVAQHGLVDALVLPGELGGDSVRERARLSDEAAFKGAYQGEGQSAGSRQHVGRTLRDHLVLLFEPVERRLLLHVRHLRNKGSGCRHGVRGLAEAGATSPCTPA